MYKKNITIGYACLDCRKTFKKHKYTQDKKGNWESVEYTVVCPECSSPMFETGSAFKAPKSNNVQEWHKLKPLFKSGYKFHPDFGNPFEELSPVKEKRQIVPKSEFRKPARKRSK